MPQPGMCWRHVVISTYNSWLPGDPRGFRSRDHRLHSSGDYKHRPPVGEHAALHKYHKELAQPKVVIPAPLRSLAGIAIRDWLMQKSLRMLAISVSATHAHCQVELPDIYVEVWRILGQCKSKAALAMQPALRGRVWASRGKALRIEDAEHQQNVYGYILDQTDAWIWSYKADVIRDPAAIHPSPQAKPAGSSAPETTP